jgi:hypothetical protein
MTSRDFCYWLQGFFEVSGAKEISPTQTQIIRNHLNMVFVHEIDPSHGTKAHQDKLGKVHQGDDPFRTRISEILECAKVDDFGPDRGPKMNC